MEWIHDRILCEIDRGVSYQNTLFVNREFVNRRRLGYYIGIITEREEWTTLRERRVRPKTPNV